MDKKKKVSFRQWQWIKKNSIWMSVSFFIFLGLGLFKLVGCGTTQFQFVPGGTDTTVQCDDPLALCCQYPEVPNEEGTRCVSKNEYCILFPNDPECTTSPEPPPDDSYDSYDSDDSDDSSRNHRDGGNSSRNSVTTTSKVIHLGKVDILFVVDNSSSMHEEHKNIENQFSDFMNDIKNLDYRIALTTVDISSSPGNVEREYQDGRFIEFGDNSIFLHNNEEDTSDRRRRHRRNEDYFKQAIVREETRRCEYEEDERNPKCPTDERAICALNHSLGRSKESSFFRTDPDVHLMIVIISDEDERSSERYIEFKGEDEYGFENCDEPETLHVNIYNRLGASKSYSVHSIIIPPGDENCLDQQSDNKGAGYYGETYAKLSRPSSRIFDNFPGLYRGNIISICERNYSSQLNVLSEYLLEPKPFTLPCEVKEDSVSLREGREDIRFRLEGKKVFIQESIPIDAKLRIRYTCQRV